MRACRLAFTPVLGVLMVRLSVFYGDGKVPLLLDLLILTIFVGFLGILSYEAGAI